MRPSYRWSMALAAVAIVATACDQAPLGTSGEDDPPGTSSGPPAGPAANVFGLMISNLPVPERVKIARDLGVAYYRPISVFLNRGGDCAECEPAAAAGLRLVLTIRNNGNGAVPTTPPADMARYKSEVRRVLERYRPVVLAVENEVNQPDLYWAGTAEQYLATLRAGCEVAHSLDIKCTDSGLTAHGVASVTVKALLAAGKDAEAVELARGALQGAQGVRTADEVRQWLASSPEGVTFAETVLAGVRGAGADFINFHWYKSDTEALRPVVDHLGRFSGLPVMTNETGQQNENPAQTERQLVLLRELGVAPIVWFSVDTEYAQGLVDPAGKLRATGEAFKRVVKGQ